MRLLLATHAVLLVLASTDFTILSFWKQNGSFQWCFFQYASSSGFGEPYRSAYDPATVATYWLAFLVGLFGFFLAWNRGRRFAGLVGSVLSAIGMLSFTLEGSHWVVEHHWSWLAFSPAAMLVLIVLAVWPSPENDTNPVEPVFVGE